MRILIANDDGYQSPGIAALHVAMNRLGEATVVAPDRNRSGASNSLTLSRPISVKHHADHVYAVEGTPADCVNIALSGLLESDVDVVVSGINDGPNMGDDVLYSGTVAAAMEGRFLGHPAIALSMATHAPQHYETAALIAEKIVKQLVVAPLAAGTILNINVPDIAIEQVRGFRLTRLGSRHPSANAIKQESPRGETIFWIGAAGSINDNSDGTDFHAVAENYVSVTPLATDLTRVDALQPVGDWLEQLS